MKQSNNAVLNSQAQMILKYIWSHNHGRDIHASQIALKLIEPNAEQKLHYLFFASIEFLYDWNVHSQMARNFGTHRRRRSFRRQKLKRKLWIGIPACIINSVKDVRLKRRLLSMSLVQSFQFWSALSATAQKTLNFSHSLPLRSQCTLFASYYSVLFCICICTRLKKQTIREHCDLYANEKQRREHKLTRNICRVLLTPFSRPNWAFQRIHKGTHSKVPSEISHEMRRQKHTTNCCMPHNNFKLYTTIFVAVFIAHESSTERRTDKRWDTKKIKWKKKHNHTHTHTVATHSHTSETNNNSLGSSSIWMKLYALEV